MSQNSQGTNNNNQNQKSDWSMKVESLAHKSGEISADRIIQEEEDQEREKRNNEYRKSIKDVRPAKIEKQ